MFHSRRVHEYVTIDLSSPLVSSPAPLPPLLPPQTQGSSGEGEGATHDSQICGKVYTKTYHLTVNMRMHQECCAPSMPVLFPVGSVTRLL